MPMSEPQNEKEKKLLEEYGDFVSLEASFPIAVRMFKQDFDTEEEWLAFKQKVQQDAKAAIAEFEDAVYDMEIEDVIGYPPKVPIAVRVVEKNAQEHK